LSTVQLAPEVVSKTKEELSAMFDEEVEAFSTYLTTLTDLRANDPLTTPEKMLIKTFLIHLYKRQVRG
jgi:hypothetical protein